jgi:glycosyltransferase involved in cell wall biosynthesis
MASHPPIAVLISLYRGDRLDLFEEALASIEAQDYPKGLVRIYLVVDGPVPELHEAFLTRHAGRFFAVVRKARNEGLALGLNDLLKRVEDEAFLFRMDGDDVADPKRFSRQVAFMQANPRVDLCGCNSIEIDDRGEVLYERNYPEHHGDIVRALPKLNPVLHPTYCIRGTSMRRDGVAYPNAHLTEDWAFLFETVRRGWTLHNLQERLLRWRTSRDFFLRRSGFKRAWPEYVAVTRGTWRLHGPSVRLVWPASRFVFRMLPVPILRRLYASQLRNRMSSGGPNSTEMPKNP